MPSLLINPLNPGILDRNNDSNYIGQISNRRESLNLLPYKDSSTNIFFRIGEILLSTK